MATQHENDKLMNLGTQVAVIDEKITTMKAAMQDQASDIKAITAAMQSFTFVKDEDYAKDQQITHSRITHLDERVTALERNTSVFVKLKTAVRERGTQLLVLALFALIIFGIYLILKHASVSTLVNGSAGEGR